MSKLKFKDWAADIGVELSEHQLRQFDSYYQLLIEWNNKMNLTSITNEDEVYEKHFYDSITAAAAYDFKKPMNIIDIGAGAGFPSLPLKICFPHLKVVIVDSLKKRMTFLTELSKELGLQDAQFIHARAELLARNKHHRDSYDAALARAVAGMPTLTELCLPFVKKGGIFIALKGAGGPDEKNEADRACNILGGEWLNSVSLTLPAEKSVRSILKIEKIKSTPKAYPRKPGTPSKKPIM
ncbi:16S rRNA (guanine(527)-N(7))-methyltransferase RsmG [Alteribacillus sp. HJP-4]|uniref:16S rRNA (guanine(527)-N(7))-methyltransferase RsmG n=1 Tax=Alteribacillus sp. HJP-4 TaxID=2775394 RepID=UPI0035CD2DB1